MPSIQFNILNQLQTPAFYASSLATRPAFGYPGRIFIDTDSPSTGIYRDTGSAWISVADSGAGSTGTLQQVTTNGSSTNVGITVSANGIGIGTTSPGTNRIDIHSGSGLQATLNGTTTNNASLQLQNAGVGKWTIRNNYNAGANDFGVFDFLNSIDRIKITNSGIISLTGVTNISSRLNVNGATDNASFQLNVAGNIFSSQSTSAANFSNDGTQYFSYSLLGRSSDNFGAFKFSSNNGATRYGYIQSGATNGGQLVLAGDGGGTLYVDNRGTLVSSAFGINNVADSVKGTNYTPTLTNVSNTSSLSPQTSFYIRVGNVVSVSTNLVGNCIAAVSNQLRISIPVGANFTTTSQGFGNGTNLYPGTGIMQVCEIVTNSGTTDMLVSFTPSAGVTSFSFKCVFQYQVQ